MPSTGLKASNRAFSATDEVTGRSVRKLSSREFVRAIAYAHEPEDAKKIVKNLIRMCQKKGDDATTLRAIQQWIAVIEKIHAIGNFAEGLRKIELDEIAGRSDEELCRDYEPSLVEDFK